MKEWRFQRYPYITMQYKKKNLPKENSTDKSLEKGQRQLNNWMQRKNKSRTRYGNRKNIIKSPNMKKE